MIELVNYEPDHYLTVSRREYDAVSFGTRGRVEIIAKKLLEGKAFSLVCEDGVVASGGILPIWTGVAEGWGITSDLVCKYPFTFAKVIHRKLIELIDFYKLIRVQTVVHKDFKVSQKWVERMGFRSEGLMEKYIAGQDYFRYAWIRRGING